LQEAKTSGCNPVSTGSILSFVLLEGYMLSAALLLGGFALLRAQRPLIKQLLTGANALVLLGASLLLVVMVQSQCQLLNSKNEADYFALSNRMFGPYWFVYWSSLLWKGLLPQVFWQAKLRRSLTVTAVVAAALLVDFFVPILPVFYRDYLPSSWAIQPNYIGLVTSTGLFAVMLASFHGLLKWRRAAVSRG
jgi:molybdopterin-containing oxidoreductase family membrane subunit